MALRVRVRIEGLQEVLAAFDELPAEAQKIVKARSLELAQSLTASIQSTAAGQGRQAVRAAAGVKAVRTTIPTITAAGPLVFGTEFGATKHFGWYRKGRYFNSAGKQFPSHRGASSYWFFKTIDHESSRIEQSYLDMAQQMCDEWGT